MFATTPYVIRAVRLVVAYNRKYRLKYARFVKRNYALGFWAVGCIGLTIRAGIFFGTDPAHYSSDMRECFYWDDIMLMGAVLLFGGAPMSCLAIRISRVHDAFKLREELCFVFIGCSCCVAVLWVIQVLVELELLSDTSALHVVVEVQALLIGMNIGLSGLLLPMVRAHRGGVKAWFRATVVPVDETVAVSALDVDGVVGLASSGGEMAEQFGKFCRENLCMESWDFLVDVVRYERMAPSPIARNPEDEQFNCFLHILNHYLLPTSPDEINISSAMHKRIAPFRTREAFNKLGLEERVSIFKEPFDEIVRVLEQNLLNKFQKLIALDRGAFVCDSWLGWHIQAIR
ncbi:unnamed protein product [Ectocarpus sp. CCAP 1310/34]|nr:unnamed protein product [Ectocarpus sp. CCAP 1310/34]